MNPEFWRGKRVFLTGHTGFKGSWLALWLQHLGAEISGYALPPETSPALFNALGLAGGINSIEANICDAAELERRITAASPEVVIHLAAQSLVRRSYDDPVETFRTNGLGTVNLLEIVRHKPSIRATVIVSSDKCYENQELARGYIEGDLLGGHDPYSASKAVTEIVTASYRKSFFAPAGLGIASARAGNVIGGGDWSEDRLVPDLIRAIGAGQCAEVRNPSAIRPWQHVLEPLSGYLLLAERLSQDPVRYSGAWNFGPEDHSSKSVRELADEVCSAWGQGAGWDSKPQPGHKHETEVLRLDSSKSRQVLGWAPTWNFQTAVSRTTGWYRKYQQDSSVGNVRSSTLADIELYMARGN